jgi:hypothetical protein
MLPRWHRRLPTDKAALGELSLQHISLRPAGPNEFTHVGERVGRLGRELAACDADRIVFPSPIALAPQRGIALCEPICDERKQLANQLVDHGRR